MRTLSDAQQRKISGGCSPNCVHADRRPSTTAPPSYNPAHPAMGGLGGWSMPAPHWPSMVAQ